MRLFITGASGWIGSAVTRELIAHGHEVVGLARNEDSAAAIAALGATPHRGDLDDLDSLSAAAEQSDGVIHLAFKHDFAHYIAAWHSEHAVVQRMLDVLAGSDRPFMLASGLSVGVEGRAITEDDRSPYVGADSMRGGSEHLAMEYAEKGVRTVALRFAASVHGEGDHGFVAALAQIARERGVSGYLGEGANHWPAVHRADAARMVRLALEKAPAGSRVHGVGDAGIATRDIAAAIGAGLGVPTMSVDPADAESHFGWLARFYGRDVVAANAITRRLLGWTPTGPGLLEDLAAGYYTR